MARFAFDTREFNLVETVEVPSGTIIMETFTQPSEVCPFCHNTITHATSYSLDSVQFWLSSDSTVNSCSLSNLVAIGSSNGATLNLDATTIQKALHLSTKLSALIGA